MTAAGRPPNYAGSNVLSYPHKSGIRGGAANLLIFIYDMESYPQEAMASAAIMMRAYAPVFPAGHSRFSPAQFFRRDKCRGALTRPRQG
jgi:hypothetical protein